MKKLSMVVLVLFAAAVSAFARGAAVDVDSARGLAVEVTITNITRGQVITPPVVISHDGRFRLFELGAPAIPELATLAEEGMTGPLTGYLDTRRDVFDYAVASGALGPGESTTVKVRVGGFYRYITAVGMLAVSNDAFFAIDGVRVEPFGTVEVMANAYDAGSEANSESCAYVPGPPCGSHNAHDPADAEGFVHVHGGIHGIGDLDPAEADWRNPVAQVRIGR